MFIAKKSLDMPFFCVMFFYIFSCFVAVQTIEGLAQKSLVFVSEIKCFKQVASEFLKDDIQNVDPEKQIDRIFDEILVCLTKMISKHFCRESKKSDLDVRELYCQHARDLIHFAKRWVKQQYYKNMTFMDDQENYQHLLETIAKEKESIMDYLFSFIVEGESEKKENEFELLKSELLKVTEDRIKGKCTPILKSTRDYYAKEYQKIFKWLSRLFDESNKLKSFLRNSLGENDIFFKLVKNIDSFIDSIKMLKERFEYIKILGSSKHYNEELVFLQTFYSKEKLRQKERLINMFDKIFEKGVRCFREIFDDIMEEENRELFQDQKKRLEDPLKTLLKLKNFDSVFSAFFEGLFDANKDLIQINLMKKDTKGEIKKLYDRQRIDDEIDRRIDSSDLNSWVYYDQIIFAIMKLLGKEIFLIYIDLKKKKYEQCLSKSLFLEKEAKKVAESMIQKIEVLSPFVKELDEFFDHWLENRDCFSENRIIKWKERLEIDWKIDFSPEEEKEFRKNMLWVTTEIKGPFMEIKSVHIEKIVKLIQFPEGKEAEEKQYWDDRVEKLLSDHGMLLKETAKDFCKFQAIPNLYSNLEGRIKGWIDRTINFNQEKRRKKDDKNYFFYYRDIRFKMQFIQKRNQVAMKGFILSLIIDGYNEEINSLKNEWAKMIKKSMLAKSNPSNLALEIDSFIIEFCEMLYKIENINTGCYKNIEQKGKNQLIKNVKNIINILNDFQKHGDIYRRELEALKYFYRVQKIRQKRRLVKFFKNFSKARLANLRESMEYMDKKYFSRYTVRFFKSTNGIDSIKEKEVFEKMQTNLADILECFNREFECWFDHFFCVERDILEIHGISVDIKKNLRILHDEERIESKINTNIGVVFEGYSNLWNDHERLTDIMIVRFEKEKAKFYAEIQSKVIAEYQERFLCLTREVDHQAHSFDESMWEYLLEKAQTLLDEIKKEGIFLTIDREKMKNILQKNLSEYFLEKDVLYNKNVFTVLDDAMLQLNELWVSLNMLKDKIRPHCHVCKKSA